MVERAQRVGRDLQLERLAERVRRHRNLEQVRHEAALGAVVGMAHIVADLDVLAREIAAARHVNSL